MRILISGFTGSLGSALTPMLLDEGHTVIGYSRCELRQANFPWHENLLSYLGDVRDRDRLIEASRHCDLIFHLAALKRVDTLEQNPEEAIQTNIDGTNNVLHAQRINKIPRVVLASTDKACYPVNIYGVTKAAAERLVLRNPNNLVCRYGNVVGSRGSVVPMFVKSLKEKNEIQVTDLEMTRFWMPIREAAGFVKHCGISGKGGLFIPPIQASRVHDMGIAVAECLGLPDYQLKIVGMRPGEKIHETLRTREEGDLLSSDQMEHRYSQNHLKNLVTELCKSS